MDDDSEFRARVRAAWSERGRSGASRGELDDARVQELKAADRAGVERLFAGSDPKLLQAVRRGSPEDVVDHLVLAQGRKSLAIFAGLLLPDLFPFA